MKILIINPILHTPVNGRILTKESNRDTMIYNMARGFVESGHQITIIACENYKPDKPGTNPFDVIYLPSYLPQIFKPTVFPYLRGLKKYLRQNRHKFDLIITSELFSPNSLIAVRQAPEKTIVWHELALMQRFMHKIPAKIWYNIIVRALMRKAKVIARSEQAREFVRPFVKEISSETVGHGCDGAVFRPSAHPVRDAFAMVCVLVPRKQPLLILETFLKFIQNPEFAHYTLDIIGDGPLLGQMKQYVEKAGKTDNVIFHGFLDHTAYPRIAATSKGLLINTIQDNSMVTIPESIAMGTPVLLNSVPLLAEEIEQHKLGICADDWNEKHLRLMSENYLEFRSNCIARRNEYTSKGCADKIVRIAGKMLNLGINSNP